MITVVGEDVQRGELGGYKIVTGNVWVMVPAQDGVGTGWVLVVAEPKTGDLRGIGLDGRLLLGSQVDAREPRIRGHQRLPSAGFARA